MDLEYCKVLDSKLADKLIPAAVELAFNIRTDMLDCGKSFMRIESDKSFEEVVELAKKLFKTDMRLVYRDYNNSFELVLERYRPGGENYFIWIELEVEDAIKLIKDFNLPPIC